MKEFVYLFIKKSRSLYVEVFKMLSIKTIIKMRYRQKKKEIIKFYYYLQIKLLKFQCYILKSLFL